MNTRAAAPAVAVALAVLAVDIGIGRLGYGLLLPAIRGALGGSYSLYGAIGAAHLSGYLIGTVVAPLLVRDRRRRPRITALAQAVVALSFAASAFARDPVGLMPARVVLGIASGVGIASAVTDALERAPLALRGRASARAWSGIGAGLVLSAPAGAWALAAPGLWRGATLTAALIAAAIVPAAWRVPPASDAVGVASGAGAWSLRALARPQQAWFVTAYALFGASYLAYATFAVAAFAARGIAGGALTAIWTAFGIAAAAGALGIGAVLSGARRRWALSVPLAMGALGSAISMLPGLASAVVGAMCVGTSLAATPAVASAFARDRSDAASYARAFASITTIFGIGQLLGPALAGAVADARGVGAAAPLAAALFAAGALCAVADALVGRRRAAHEASAA